VKGGDDSRGLALGAVALALLACSGARAHQRGEAVADQVAQPGAFSDEEAGGVESDLAPAPAAAPARPAARVTKARAEVPAGPSGSQEPAAATARAPMLVYTAQLTLAIFEVRATLKAVETLARDLGGFMASQSDAAMTIRVPVGRFQEAIAQLEKMGDIIQRDIRAEDVTQQHFDLEVRLKSARAVRERLEQLLSRATKVEESIAIERELERVVGEIERLEGSLKYLRDRAQFSTIALRFSTLPQEVVAKGSFRLPFPWLDKLGLGRLLDLR
jgi:hypothetical protein